MANRVGAGRRRRLVLVQNPDGKPVPDGDGGHKQSWRDATPATLYVSIEPATARDAERWVHNTVTAGQSLIVTGAYHAGITTRSRLIVDGARILQVAGVENPGDANKETIMFCIESEATP